MRPNVQVYIISDTHFNHWNINKHCNRKFKNLGEMNNTMIRRWNSVVREQDIIVHMGDFIFTKGESRKIFKIIKKLKGRKIITIGNHDRKSYHFYLNHGMDFVCDSFSWYYMSKKVLFLHDPHKITSSDTRKYDYIIHGHTHGKGKMVRKRKTCTLINVSVEHIGYAPILLNTLLNKFGN